MKIAHHFTSTSALKGGSYAVLVSLLVPIAGCGGQSTPPPPIEQAQAPSMSRNTGTRSAGLSTKQKVVLLAGAAAMYYYYQKSKKNNAKLAGQNVQYYLSKNGRVYYRDPQTHQAVWVTPSPDQAQPVQLPADQAQPYAQIQGYNNQTTGNGLDYYFKPGD